MKIYTAANRRCDHQKFNDYLCSKTEGNTPLVARTVLRQITGRLERYVPDEYLNAGHQVVKIEVNWDPDGMVAWKHTPYSGRPLTH